MLLVVAGFSMEHFNDLLNTRACVKKAFIDSILLPRLRYFLLFTLTKLTAD